MRTSLQAIASRAKENKKRRFRNLYTMLNEENLTDSWKFMNRHAAPGVDRQTVQEYELNLKENIRDLVARLKEKRYRAKLVRRVYIPKGNGKLRPLGLPAIEDKLVQTAVARILSAIYEQDFLSVSYGYRPHRGASGAAGELRRQLQLGRYNYVVEADIKGFFDNIEHEWLIQMLRERIEDEAFIRLIRKWLRAGILETDGKVLHPVTGTPQGGIVSPVLANIYLHYALDLWFEKIVKAHCSGEATLVRYADDWVAAFHTSGDAQRFYRAAGMRLAKFGLTLAPEKTRTIRFSRFWMEKGGSFDFLGFEYRWVISRSGKPFVRRRTSRKKLRASLASLKEWCRENRGIHIRLFMEMMNRKLRGYYNYYGVFGNSKGIYEFYRSAVRIMFSSLNRRSQRRSFSWKTFRLAMDHYKLLRPRTMEDINKPVQLDLVYEF